MISAGTLGLALGTAAGGPAGGVAGSALGGLLGGGAATDAARATREDWTIAEANRGSPTAAAIAIAAPANVSGNEAQRWRDVTAKLSPNMRAAAVAEYGAGGWWPQGQPDFYTDVQGATHQQILAEVAQSALSMSSTSGAPPATGTTATSTTGLVTGTGTGPRPQSLPAMVSTAKSPTVWIAVGGILLLVLVVVMLGRRK